MISNSGVLLDRTVSSYPSISLSEMDAVKLLNRIDTKYLTNEKHLTEILNYTLKANFRVLTVNGERFCPYRSIYYDTPTLKTFLDHHNGRKTRQKIRTREYILSKETFLEIKSKNNKGRTCKKRIRIPLEEFNNFSQDTIACDYLNQNSWFEAEEMSPVLEVSFTRITLVDQKNTERITIDSDIKFHNFRTEKNVNLLDAVVIELKQDSRSDSLMKKYLLDNRIKPIPVSKYCIAVTLTDNSVHTGGFKEKIRIIEKILNNKITIQ